MFFKKKPSPDSRLATNILVAVSEQRLIDAHVANAQDWITKLGGVSYGAQAIDEATETYLSVMGVSEPIRTIVFHRVLAQAGGSNVRAT